MSNDLISRKALLTEIANSFLIPILKMNLKPEHMTIIKIEEIIKNMPTAFDKENVINEIKEYKEDAEEWAKKSVENADEFYTYADAYKNCLEIIEKGGIE